jgi:ribosome-associated protein
MESKSLALLIRELADSKKAENISILDVRGLSTELDYFVIATGSSEPHLRAIVDEISVKVEEATGDKPRAVDGRVSTPWIVLDYIDVIVHVMRPEVRARYDLESLWGDAARVRPARKRVAKSKTAPAV